jgi:peptide/nickel transport system substrate-binding protein
MNWARIVVPAIVVVVLLLGACTPTSTPTPVVETVEVPGPTQVVTATPSPTPVPPSRLVICQEEEPETLYFYGGSQAARNILEGIYDGPIDHRQYGFQPVILEKIPSLEDGDAYFESVIVREGDRVVDITGRPADLEAGVQVFPSHACVDASNPDCIATFEGTPIEMEHMVVSWQLLEELTWSDGEPLTADDSVYSYELACHADTPTPASIRDICENSASYTAAGATTAVWKGLPGYIDDLYFLNFFSPLPRHAWQEESRYTPAELLSNPDSTRIPLGWGPFVITEWVEGESIHMERNPLYFRADQDLPAVEEVIFRFAGDVHGLLAMFLSGQCDVGLVGDGQLARLYGELGQVMPLLVAAEEEGLFTLVTTTNEVWEHLEFGIVPVEEGRGTDLFGDPRTRQAIAQCIDRQTMMEEVTYGRGEVAYSYVPATHPLFAGNRITRWAYDPRAGQAMLAEVGWADEDEDGYLEAQDVEDVRRGTPFRLDLMLVAEDRQQDAIARIIRSNLADCGIQADLVYVPVEEFLADGPEGPLLGRRFDLALFHWYNGVEPPCDLYLSEQIPGPNDWGRANIAGFSYDAYDGTCRAALASLPGTREYEQHHIEAQEIFSEQLPDIPLFWWIRVAIARPGVANFLLDPSEESELWNIEVLDRVQ